MEDRDQSSNYGIQHSATSILNDLGFKVLEFDSLNYIYVSRGEKEKKVVTLANMDSYLPIIAKHDLDIEVMAVDGQCKAIVSVDYGANGYTFEHVSAFPSHSMVIAMGKMVRRLKYVKKGKK